MKINKILLFVIVLAIFLRVVDPSNLFALNWDEVSHGYNAFSILKTAQDEWGVRLPVIFRAYGDYKLPVYIYLTSFSEFFFGLTNFAVRLPSILAGVGIVLFSYLLATSLFNKSVGFFTAFFVAIEPWSFFLSRIAVEANVSLFFIVAATYFFIKCIDDERLLILSSLFFGLSVWSYNSARIFVPLFIFALCIIYSGELKKIILVHKKVAFVASIVLGLFFLPMFYQLARPAGYARYSLVAILDTGAINKINELQSTSRYGRLLYNKVTYFTNEFVKNYFSHFDPRYLFISGGTHYQFSAPGFGLLYPVNSVFMLVGLGYLFIVRGKNVYLVLAWLLLGPIASAMTRESPHVLRAITMLPMPMILSAVGLTKSWDILKNRKIFQLKPVKILIVATYVLLLFLSFEKYIYNYFFIYPNKYSQAWQFGYQSVVEYAKLRYSDFDQIIVSKKYGEPHEYFLFYGAMLNAPWSWQPDSFRNNAELIRYQQSNWYWVDRFDNFYFVNDWEVPKQNSNWKTEGDIPISVNGKKNLLITSPDNFPSEGWVKQKSIYFLDGTVAFDVLSSI